ncbi:hypothetical protein EJB05_25927, partial [Eragrostis curvula]
RVTLAAKRRALATPKWQASSGAGRRRDGEGYAARGTGEGRVAVHGSHPGGRRSTRTSLPDRWLATRGGKNRRGELGRQRRLPKWYTLYGDRPSRTTASKPQRCTRAGMEAYHNASWLGSRGREQMTLNAYKLRLYFFSCTYHWRVQQGTLLQSQTYVWRMGDPVTILIDVVEDVKSPVVLLHCYYMPNWNEYNTNVWMVESVRDSRSDDGRSMGAVASVLVNVLHAGTSSCQVRSHPARPQPTKLACPP